MLKDGRMETIYGMVRRGVTVCDVGTDHAIIPIELVKNDICPSAIATDISAPSLEKGAKNIKKAGCAGKIETYCTNGTISVPLKKEMDFIIAGMGGELIIKIISQDERLRDPFFRFILQPMTKSDELRAYLAENGYKMLLETKVEADGRIYAVINACYTGEKYSLSITETLFGVTPNPKNELEILYAEKEERRLEAKIHGLEISDTEESLAEKQKAKATLTEVRKYIESLK